MRATHDSAWDVFASDDPRAMASRFPLVHGWPASSWAVGLLVVLVLFAAAVCVWVLVLAQRARDDVDAVRLTRWYGEIRELAEDELLRYTGGKVRPAAPGE